MLRSLRPPAPQIVLVALTGLTIGALATVGVLRRWAASVDVRVLVSVHLTRFVGLYFLYLWRRGELPYDFAVPGGIGDIIVAAGALGVLLVRDETARRRAVLAWNVVGLADILFVVATAVRLALTDPESMSALLRLPLCLLPTFLVPIVIATHVLIFVRLGVGSR
ncbi:MAG: hypothetical protein LC135_00575 [Phycisphaerae bacterium]|nr:hypothetical protein [Phycisphaerae bacterium]MCZ2398346.1 hypothetical protein [Phycisphaerae bacterium]NUQ50552.1 hypothetical protein [Phycisphaerae bacterium]